MSGQWSGVWKDSAAGVPFWRYEFGGGRRYRNRYIQYSPSKAIVSSRLVSRESPPPVSSTGATSIGTFSGSGCRMTPGEVPSVELAASAGGGVPGGGDG